MKPFNLERALAGDPVITRSGEEVERLTYFEGAKNEYPIVALVDSYIEHYTIDGFFSSDKNTSANDLFMKPMKKKLYLWVSNTAGNSDYHACSHLFKTKENLEERFSQEIETKTGQVIEIEIEI